MEITREQYAKIAESFPRQRGNVSIDNLSVLNAILYVAENGCKWRALPKRFGNWHTIYTRMNRWARAGVLDRVLARLQTEQMIRIRIECASRGRPDGVDKAAPKRPADYEPEAQPKFIWLLRMPAER